MARSNSPMNKHSAFSVNVSGLILICGRTLYIIFPAAQAMVDESVALRKPFDEVFFVNIINRDM
jgi:hypothetical protein